MGSSIEITVSVQLEIVYGKYAINTDITLLKLRFLYNNFVAGQQSKPVPCSVLCKDKFHSIVISKNV